MTEIAISALPEATAIEDADELLVVQGGVTKRFSATLLDHSGWVEYFDSKVTVGTAQSFANGVAQALEIDGTTSDLTQEPIDVITPMWDTTNDKIIPIALGDSYTIRIEFDAENYAGVSPSIELQLDVGGSTGVVADHTYPLLKNGADTKMSITMMVRANSDMVANGALVKLIYEGTGTCDVFNAHIMITRTHRAR